MAIEVSFVQPNVGLNCLKFIKLIITVVVMFNPLIKFDSKLFGLHIDNAQTRMFTGICNVF